MKITANSRKILISILKKELAQDMDPRAQIILDSFKGKGHGDWGGADYPYIETTHNEGILTALVEICPKKISQ